MPNDLHVRVDNRLLHGQVVQFWIPYLALERLVIADDPAAADSALHAVYRAALPEHVELAVTPVAEVARSIDAGRPGATLVLLSDVADAARARAAGLRFERLTLGNVHATAARTRVTDSVHLTAAETALLATLVEDGIVVEIQTFPGETLRLQPGAGGAPRWSKR